MSESFIIGILDRGHLEHLRHRLLLDPLIVEPLTITPRRDDLRTRMILVLRVQDVIDSIADYYQ
jgi:hypothetical protein